MKDIEGYYKEELTIEAGKANGLALLYFIPFILIFGLPYWLIWQETFSMQNLGSVVLKFKLNLITVMLLGIIAHEFIHGLTWSLFTKKGLKSISYGILWKSLTPFCHCDEPLSVRHYIIGAIMPAVILGFFPLIIAIFIGSLGFFIFGIFFTFAAGGDFMIINMLRKENPNNLVQDHPSKIGCFLYKSMNDSLGKNQR
jgi:Putative zincin peptidase